MKKNKVKLVSNKSKIALVCSLIICSVFFTSFLLTQPLAKSECDTVTISYQNSKEVKGRFTENRGIYIYDEYSQSYCYYIDEFYLGHGLKEKIESLAEDSTITLTVDRESGEIIEFSTDVEALLSYENYMQSVHNEKIFNFAIFLLSFILPVICIFRIIKEKKDLTKINLQGFDV